MNSYLQMYSDSEASFLKKRLQQHVQCLDFVSFHNLSIPGLLPADPGPAPRFL